MAHHTSDGPFGPEHDAVQAFKKLVTEPALEKVLQSNFGPTDKHPEGKLSVHDEGELRFGVASMKGKVIVDFGSPVHSLVLTKSQACELGRLLINHAGYICKIEIG